MLFINNELNSKKYDFEHNPTDIEDYSFRDVSNELSDFTQKIFNLLSNNKTIETTIKNKEGKAYLINVGTLLNDSSFVFNRTSDDIYRIIVSKKDFKKNLEKIGFVEPKNRKEEFVLYLQVVYFFYIMIYFIFPKVKFYDLYDEKNLSSENTLESNTGNEIYEKFIKDALYQNKKIKDLGNMLEKRYDAAIDKYNDAFFSLFELEYYNYINMPIIGSKEVFENSLSKKTISSYIKHFEKLYQKNVSINIEDEQQERNIYESYFDYINTKQTKAVVLDFKNSSEALKPYINKLVSKKVDIKIPEKLKDIKVHEDELFDVLNDDEEFIKIVMNASKLTNTIKDKYYSYDFVDAIDGIWDFEKGQIENYGNNGFTFLKKYKKYYMSKYDLATICITFKNLDLNVSYVSKRTYLNNRSDSMKADFHSIKRSYKAKAQENFNVSVSSLRDGIFRIVCRMIGLGINNGNYNEFLYYEYPMNLLNNKYVLEIEKLNSISSKTMYYEKAADAMNNI